MLLSSLPGYPSDSLPSERVLHSHRIQEVDPLKATIPYTDAVDGLGPLEALAGNGDYMMDSFELSDPPLHPSKNLARAHRIVSTLPQELVKQGYVLKRPLVVDLECVSKGNVVASFYDSDSHMSGSNQDIAIKELIIWMADEYADLRAMDPDAFVYPLRSKWKALEAHLARIEHGHPEQTGIA